MERVPDGNDGNGSLISSKVMSNSLTDLGGLVLSALSEFETENFVSFHTSGQWLGLSIEKVRDILSLEKIASITPAQSQVSVSINQRGHILAVFNVPVCLLINPRLLRRLPVISNKKGMANINFGRKPKPR